MSSVYLRQQSDGGLKTKNTFRSYARQNSTGSIKSTNDHKDDRCKTNAIEEHIQLTSTNNNAEHSSETSKQPLNYATYLNLSRVLHSVRCLSHVNPLDETSPSVHDEYFFITIHQSKSLRKQFRIS